MAKNEDGEFELVLGNNQLLSVFFLVVLLLALCFVGGYVVGRDAAPTLAAVPAGSSIATAAPEMLVAKDESVREEPEPAPTKAVAPAPEPKPEPEHLTPKVEAKPEIRPEPVSAPIPITTKQQAASSQPIAGRIYLQLSATDKDRAEMMVDLIRSKNMPAIAAGIADRPNLYRVLVGPLTDAELPETRAQLKANSFPADEAIRRVF